MASVTGNERAVEAGCDEGILGDGPVGAGCDVDVNSKVVAEPVDDQVHGGYVASVAVEEDESSHAVAREARGDVAEQGDVGHRADADGSAVLEVVVREPEREGRGEEDTFFGRSAFDGALGNGGHGGGVHAHRQVMAVLLGRAERYDDGAVRRVCGELVSGEGVKSP